MSTNPSSLDVASMTLRQWYAGLALQGLLARGRDDDVAVDEAWSIADAMMERANG